MRITFWWSRLRTIMSFGAISLTTRFENETLLLAERRKGAWMIIIISVTWSKRESANVCFALIKSTPITIASTRSYKTMTLLITQIILTMLISPKNTTATPLLVGATTCHSSHVRVSVAQSIWCRLSPTPLILTTWFLNRALSRAIWREWWRWHRTIMSCTCGRTCTPIGTLSGSISALKILEPRCLIGE